MSEQDRDKSKILSIEERSLPPGIALLVSQAVDGFFGNVDLALSHCRMVIRKVHGRSGFFRGWASLLEHGTTLTDAKTHIEACGSCRAAFASIQKLLTTPIGTLPF